MAPLLLTLAPATLPAQQPTIPTPVLRAADVDRLGVWRWTDNRSEVALFGVNYTAPFAYAYRALGYVGAERKAAIDMDVAHFARLGLTAYRIHVWDREVSDRQGNLLENEHLDLLDYLIARLEQRGIHVVLTPIAWWGTGYPEPDPPAPGFSSVYSKGALTVDTAARRIQQSYVRQFVAHVNRYTGRSYREDPGILALELFNEPNHPGTAAQTTEFIDALASAARAGGWRKPIFYNVAEGWTPEHARAVCAAAIQGITFQWYPTGLVRGAENRGIMLPNVDRYPIPLESAPGCREKTRLVYEFDAADVLGSYMYPAMARSFRGAGMQLAAMFAYDPAALAHANTEYQTHFLNLLYTPGKAISLLIAGEAFRTLPRGFSAGVYPADTAFAPFRVSFGGDRSELNRPDAFYYSNDTGARPADPRALRHVAGVGTSPVVEYGGTGAYFLDRLADGVWRLEVYPDAVLLRDPFGRQTVADTVARLVWRTWPMRIALPELGPSFSVQGVNAGNTLQATASGGRFDVRPGVYVLARRGVSTAAWRDPALPVGNLALGEFHVPAPRPFSAAVVNRSPAVVDAGRLFRLQATVATMEPPTRVILELSDPGMDESVRMRQVRGYNWEEGIPPAPAGELRYRVVVTEAGAPARVTVFPGGTTAPDSAWRVEVVPPGAPIVLFDAGRDRANLLFPHPFRYVPFRAGVSPDSAGGTALRLQVRSLAPAPHELALRSFLGEENRSRLKDAAGFRAVRVRARAAAGPPDSLVVALVERNGVAWGAVVHLDNAWREVAVPLSAFRRVPLALLPRSYPQFLPEHLTVPSGVGGAVPDLRNLDGIQLTVGGTLYEEAERTRPRDFEVERVELVATGGRPAGATPPSAREPPR